MIAFLNERSLSDNGNWRDSLILFWRMAKELEGASAHLFRDSVFFSSAEFKRRFNAMGFPELAHGQVEEQRGRSQDEHIPPDIRSALRQMSFTDRYWRCWRPSRSSSNITDYSCELMRQTFRDESLCEAAERKIQDNRADLGVISAAHSAFADFTPLTLCNLETSQTAALRNASSLEIVRHWIASQRGHYDPASNTAPKDYQTVLEKDPRRFQRTDRFWNVAGKDRRIFREVATGRFFYVDEGHPGPSAHLEVFDADGNHVGEADINAGMVDGSKRVEGRKIVV